MRRRVIEPVDEALHFSFHGGGWRRFEMNLRIADRAGDDLHRLIMRSVGANVFQISPAGCKHAMPSEHGFVRERLGEAAIEIHRHVGDALLGGRNSTRVSIEPEIAPDGRLHALAVEVLAFNLGSLESLVADEVDGQRVFVVVADM